MKKKIKNKDLAAKLGVSSTLVSLVLNNKADQHGIRKDTQEKVLTLARQMGYFQTVSEKDQVLPVEEKPGILGMVVPSMHDPFVIQISQYLQKAFSSIGVGFSIVTKDPDDQRYNRLIGSLRKFYSGIILLGDAADDNTIRNLRTNNYPFILLEKSLKTLRLNTICTDVRSGIDTVTNHLKKLGYKNLIVVDSKKQGHNHTGYAGDVADAFRRMEDVNAPVIIEVETSGEMDFSRFDKYLRPPFRADAMVIMNANLVYPVMKMFNDKKIRIPQDIAIISMEEGIGFDLMYTSVTSLRKPLSAIAVKAANMIWSEVKNGGKGKYKRQVNVQPELIIRNSCGSI